MKLEPMCIEDVGFAYECLEELRGAAQYSEASFRRYIEEARLLEHPDFRILIGIEDGTRVGMLTCNRFAMPRYLGYGYELEEVVIHPRHQGRGLARPLVSAFLESVAQRPEVRKVIVKTDDEGRAARVYERLFGRVAARVYARTVNRL
jgi:GNAT superfamily N-acetyltransferase